MSAEAWATAPGAVKPILGYIMKNKTDRKEPSQADWQAEREGIVRQIRANRSVTRQLQSDNQQLKASLEEIDARHRRRRRCPWDDDTPLIRLVSPPQIEHFWTLMKDWEKRAAAPIDPAKTSQFSFHPKLKHHAYRALAVVLARQPPVFRVSTRQLCQYLAEHSNLGTMAGIKKALQRAGKVGT